MAVHARRGRRRTGACGPGSCLVVVRERRRSVAQRGERPPAAGARRARRRAARPGRVVGVGARAGRPGRRGGARRSRSSPSQPEREPLAAGLPAPARAARPRYLACVVPAFDAGRKAGLGLGGHGRRRGPPRAGLGRRRSRGSTLPGLLPLGVRDGRGRRLRDARAPLLTGGAVGASVGRRAADASAPAVRAARAGACSSSRARSLAAGAPRAARADAAPSRPRCATCVNLSAGRRRDAAGLRQLAGRRSRPCPPTPRRRAWLRELNLDPSARARRRARRARSSRSARSSSSRPRGSSSATPTRCARLERRLDVGGRRARLGRPPPPRSRWTPGRLLQFLGPGPGARCATSPQTLARLARAPGLPASFSVGGRSAARCDPPGTVARRRSRERRRRCSCSRRSVGACRRCRRSRVGTPGARDAGPRGRRRSRRRVRSSRRRWRATASALGPVRDYAQRLRHRTRSTGRHCRSARPRPSRPGCSRAVDPRQTVPTRFYARVTAAGGARGGAPGGHHRRRASHVPAADVRGAARPLARAAAAGRRRRSSPTRSRC